MSSFTEEGAYAVVLGAIVLGAKVLGAIVLSASELEGSERRGGRSLVAVVQGLGYECLPSGR